MEERAAREAEQTAIGAVQAVADKGSSPLAGTLK